MTNLDSILKSRDITLTTKVRLVKAMVFPVVMYGCESWTVKKAEHRRIDAFELWCWRRLLRVPWTARRSNQSILKEVSPGCSLESESEVAQSCPTLCDLMDCSPPGSSLHGIFQARVLEWGAIAFSTPKYTASKYIKHQFKEMANHASVLAWRIPGTGEPGGLPSMGSHRVGHD